MMAMTTSSSISVKALVEGGFIIIHVRSVREPDIFQNEFLGRVLTWLLKPRGAFPR